MTPFTQAQLKQLLTYDANTGEFRWLLTGRGRRLDKVAGGLNVRGYRVIVIDGEYRYAHRLAWFYVTGEWPVADVDHVNGTPSDNRWINLRVATQAENSRNQSISHSNTSGFKGVWHIKKTGRWRSGIMVDRKSIHLGVYDTPHNAHAAYCVAAQKYHGQFARTA